MHDSGAAVIRGINTNRILLSLLQESEGRLAAAVAVVDKAKLCRDLGIIKDRFDLGSIIWYPCVEA